MRRNLAELCCGSAALTLHLHGAEPPMPYMGGKARYAAAIAALYGMERPRLGLLADTGLWSEAWRVLFDVTRRPAVVSAVSRLVASKEDPRAMWQRLRTEPVPESAVQRVAVFLVLQRLAFSGKPVTISGGKWSDPGFQETAGYGRAGTDRFGEVLPQLPSLPDRLLVLPYLLDTDALRCSATAVLVPPDAPLWDVYIDPPYAGTTGYGVDDLTRDEVLDIAMRWSAAGARVIVSEAEPLPLPGWRHVEITGERAGRASSWQRREWLTSNAAPAQALMFVGSPSLPVERRRLT